MNEYLLRLIGGVLASAAFVGALLIVLGIVKIVLGITTSAVSQTIRLFLQFLCSKATDVCFLNMLGIIFCLIAERLPGAEWSFFALIVSASAFVQASLYIVALLVSGSGIRVFHNAAAGHIFHQIRLNIGFLGLLFLSLSFCSTCYAWHQIAARGENNFEQFQTVEDEAGYEVWFSYTAQQCVDSLPNLITDEFHWHFSDITTEDGARHLAAFAFAFRMMFWAGLAAQLAALLLPKRVLALE